MIPAFLAAALAVGAGDPDYVTDAQGRTFRVGFDPGTRWLLGVGYTRDEAEGDAASVELGIHFRATDRDDYRTWKLSHSLGDVSATFAGDASRFDGTLYHGQYLRWSKDGGVVIPTVPPTRLSFPIDIGWNLELGRLRTNLESDKFKAEIGAIGAEILFDFWRSRQHGSWFVLGVGPRYDIALDRADGGAGVRHVVVPFSRARLTVHHEWCQGKQVFEASADASTAWTSDETWSDHAGANLSWEWTFMAVNDAPLSLRLAADWRWDELYRDDHHDGHDLRASAGLRLGL